MILKYTSYKNKQVMELSIHQYINTSHDINMGRADAFVFFS